MRERVKFVVAAALVAVLVASAVGSARSGSVGAAPVSHYGVSGGVIRQVVAHEASIQGVPGAVPAAPSALMANISGVGHFVPRVSTGPHGEAGFEYYVGMSKVAAFTNSGVYMLFSNSTDNETAVALYTTFHDSAVVAPQGYVNSPLRRSFMFGSSGWETDLPTYDVVAYVGLWPGIDLVYYGTAEGLKYDYQVAAGADYTDISFEVNGGDSVSIADGGDALDFMTQIGNITDGGLYAEFTNGTEVEANFTLSGNNVSFVCAPTGGDAFVIDPRIYATFLGGTAQDYGSTIKADENGSIYVAGYTTSSDFPATPGAYNLTTNGNTDMFVSKFAPNGSVLEHSTHLGGVGDDQVYDMELVGGGTVYVTGNTRSADYPTTPGAHDTVSDGNDITVTVLASNFSTLLYSTVLGGSDGTDNGFGVAVNDTGDIHIAGWTSSTNFPTTTGAFDSSWNGGTADIIYSVVRPAGGGTSDLLYSTYIGGPDTQTASDLVLDENSTAYICGTSRGAVTAGMVTPNAVYATNPGGLTWYIGRIDPTPYDGNTTNEITYGTYYGNAADQTAYDLEVIQSGDIYVVGGGGLSTSAFPTTGGANKTADAGAGTDGALVRLTPAGVGYSVVYATLHGVDGFADGLLGLDVASDGRAVVSGYTNTPTAYPYCTADADQITTTAPVSPGRGCVVTVFSADGSWRDFTTTIDSVDNADFAEDVIIGIADSPWALAATGTLGGAWTTTPGAFQNNTHVLGTISAFVWAYELDTVAPALDIEVAPATVLFGERFTVVMNASGRAGLYPSNVSLVNITFDGVTYTMTQNSTEPDFWHWSQLQVAGLGAYSWNVTAWDAAGNSNATAIESLTVLADTISPVVTVHSAPSSVDQFSNSTVLVNVTDNVKVEHVWVQYYGTNTTLPASGAPNQWVWEQNQTIAGTYAYQFVANDTYGTEGNNTVQYLQVNDTESPTVVSVTEDTDPVDQFTDVTVAATATDNVGVVAVNVTAAGADYPMSFNGTHWVWVKNQTLAGVVQYNVTAGDARGNTDTVGPYTFGVTDREDPVVTLLIEPAIVEVYTQLVVVADVTDNVGATEVNITIDGVDFPMYPTGNPDEWEHSQVQTTIGGHNYTVTAEDAEGNVGGTFLRFYTVNDTTPPSVTIIQAPDELDQGDTYTIIFGVADNYGLSGVVVRKNGDQHNVRPYKETGFLYWSEDQNAAGIFSVKVIATDQFGNTEVTDPQVFVVSEDDVSTTPSGEEEEKAPAVPKVVLVRTADRSSIQYYAWHIMYASIIGGITVAAVIIGDWKSVVVGGVLLGVMVGSWAATQLMYPDVMDKGVWWHDDVNARNWDYWLTRGDRWNAYDSAYDQLYADYEASGFADPVGWAAQSTALFGEYWTNETLLYVATNQRNTNEWNDFWASYYDAWLGRG